MAALLIRIRPAGPWRPGSATGARDRVDPLFHSDALYSALASAMSALGWGEEWLADTAQAASPAVRLSSLFPSCGRDLLVPAPAPVWPPPNASRLRVSGTRFVPARLIAALEAGQSWNEDRWEVDGWSQAVLARTSHAGRSLYRMTLRSHSAVDRIEPGRTLLHQTACVEYGEDAGLWCVAECARDPWPARVEAAFRVLADTGLGGERSNGWGHFTVDHTEYGGLRQLVLGDPGPAVAEGAAPSVTGHWLLALLSPAEDDAIDWTRGAYSLEERGGRVESAPGWGLEKKRVRMVTEGSVLVAAHPPRGSARNVAPEGFPHPVWRAGFGLSLELRWRAQA